MNNELTSLLENSSDGLKQEFLEQNSSKLNVKSDYKKTEFDYSWLEKQKKQFLTQIQQLEILQVLLFKKKKLFPQNELKITLESIKHLATHTNLIQDYDYEQGTITPSKVLNINKEESFDIYENRFIYSLIINLQMFIARRKEMTKEGSSCKINKNFNYQATTKVGNEKIKINAGLTN